VSTPTKRIRRNGMPAGHQGTRIDLRRPPRVAVRLDMMPVASMAFLLLLSHALIAGNQKPHAIELSRPPNTDTGTPIATSKVLTVRIFSKSDRSMGIRWDRDGGVPEVVSIEALGNTLMAEAFKTEDMFVDLKVERTVVYDDFVAVIDELNTAGIDVIGSRRRDDDDRFLGRVTAMHFGR
jgi:biopolymer transport protein ExbD